MDLSQFFRLPYTGQANGRINSFRRNSKVLIMMKEARENMLGAFVVGILFMSLGPQLPGQQDSAKLSPSSPMPSYLVATIKPAKTDEYAPVLRVYIQGAFGIPINSKGWVVGPDWINSARYVIRGKPSEALQLAMQTMNAAERTKQEQLMKQDLLTDRFKMKAHFEMRDMPVYELQIMKGGPKLKENPETGKSSLAVSASLIRGSDATLHNLLGALESVPDVDGRVVLDKTGLLGNYDFTLSWAPLEGTPASEVQSSTLFTAVQEQLGLKLVPNRVLGQVLVIDQIEKPSEN